MKKTPALILCAFIIISLFCGCQSEVSDDLTYMISFECENENTGWNYELSDEGIVTVTQETQNNENGKPSVMYLLESVGEGETEIRFVSTDIQSGEVLRKVTYSVSVDSSFKITMKLLGDEVPEPATEPVISINNRTQAENFVRDRLTENNPGYEGNLVFKTERRSDGRFTVRVFRIVTDKNGKAVREYFITFIVSADGSFSQKTEKK